MVDQNARFIYDCYNMRVCLFIFGLHKGTPNAYIWCFWIQFNNHNNFVFIFMLVTAVSDIRYKKITVYAFCYKRHVSRVAHLGREK